MDHLRDAYRYGAIQSGNLDIRAQDGFPGQQGKVDLEVLRGLLEEHVERMGLETNLQVEIAGASRPPVRGALALEPDAVTRAHPLRQSDIELLGSEAP